MTVRNAIKQPWHYIIPLFLLSIGALVSSCLEFRMSGKEVEKEFEEESIRPEVVSFEVGNQQMTYALIDQQHQTLIVFIHGAPGSWSAFVDFLKNDDLAAKANLISVDRPGYGYSGFGDPVVSLKQQAYFIEEVIKRHHAENIILIGHSLGGPVAVKLAMDYPELVDGMILVAPSIDPEQEKQEWYRPLGRNWLAKAIIPRSLWVTNEEIYFLKDELELMLADWETIEASTIVIHGEDDNLVPVENAAFAERMMKPEHLTVRTYPQVNHFIPWNQPQLIYEAIDDLLIDESIQK
ncbi:MAG: alpha/beta hydrolase [Bacteroidota bacterium]